MTRFRRRFDFEFDFEFEGGSSFVPQKGGRFCSSSTNKSRAALHTLPLSFRFGFSCHPDRGARAFRAPTRDRSSIPTSPSPSKFVLQRSGNLAPVALVLAAVALA